MLLVSVSHLLYIKVPGLFVFPDTASYIYQDRLIGMLALGWSFWLWTGIKNPESIRLLPFAGLISVITIWSEVLFFPDLIDQGYQLPQYLAACLQTIYVGGLWFLLRRHFSVSEVLSFIRRFSIFAPERWQSGRMRRS